MNKFFNTFTLIFVIFLIGNLTPANAVNLGEIQNNVNDLKNDANSHDINKQSFVAKLKLLKSQLSDLNNESKINTKKIKKENKLMEEKRQNLLKYMDSDVKDGSNTYLGSHVDHVIFKLSDEGINVNKAIVPMDQLKDNTIVQIINKKGYIRYIVYDGIVQSEDGKTVVLVNDKYKRYIPLEEFQEEYTGITLINPTDIPSTNITQEILNIQKKDLEEKLAPIKQARNNAQTTLHILYSIDALIALVLIVGIILIGIGIYAYGVCISVAAILAALGNFGIALWATFTALSSWLQVIIVLISIIASIVVVYTFSKRDEIKTLDRSIKLIEDEMINIGIEP